SYGNIPYNQNLNSTISSLKSKSRQFEDVLDRELDRGRIDGTNREDQLNDLAKNFKKAVEKLDDEYDDTRSYDRSRDEAQRVLALGSQLDRAISVSRLNRNSAVGSYWNAIENDLRVLSQAFRVNYDSRSSRNNGNNGWGNNRNQGGPIFGGNNRGQNRNLRSTIVNLKNRTGQFENRVDREFKNNRNNRKNRNYGGGWFGSNNLENLTNRFNSAVKRLEREYDNRRDYNSSSDEVRQVLNLGSQVDRELSRSAANYNLRNDWNRIEQDLRILAQAYNLRYN
ncbi:MAG: hypothetical protein KDB79_00520, partial [Acidobacteria bacterium]|nr:hypothetical protein [Acidobacteriota bacterium]